MHSILSEKQFHDETAAYAFVEARIWRAGVTCPHCGNADAKHIGKLTGKSTRIGVRKCYACRKPFTVKVGTIFESSHVPMRHWLQAIYLIASSKKGVSANQLHRTLGCTLKTAWFIGHRIREAMREGGLGPMGGEGMTVEADETYYGPAKDQTPRDRAPAQGARTGGQRKPGFYKRPIVGLVERGGQVRMFHVEQATQENVARLVTENVRKESALMTDQSHLYKAVGKTFASHDTTNHSDDEYVRYEGEKVVHSNTIENVFSVFKRGMRGVYQHCDEKHLHRYLAEFDFRYNRRTALGFEDTGRADLLVAAAKGKRLTYQTTRAR